MPKRIQRQRQRGWRMPPRTRYVGRGSKYGNLWSVGLVACGCRAVGECTHNAFRVETAAEAVEMYRRYWQQRLDGPNGWRARRDLWEIRGMDLACWCAQGEPCHADVLLELANDDRITGDHFSA